MFRFKLFWLIWVAIILVLTLVPIDFSGSVPSSLERIPFFDKIVHFVIFGVLAFIGAFVSRKRLRQMRAKIIFDLVTVVVIGGGIELIQPYFGRSADWFDFAADVAGGVCGVLFAVAYARKRGAGVVDKL